MFTSFTSLEIEIAWIDLIALTLEIRSEIWRNFKFVKAVCIILNKCNIAIIHVISYLHWMQFHVHFQHAFFHYSKSTKIVCYTFDMHCAAEIRSLILTHKRKRLHSWVWVDYMRIQSKLAMDECIVYSQFQLVPTVGRNLKVHVYEN